MVAIRTAAGAVVALFGLDAVGAQEPPACASLSNGRVPAEVAELVAKTLHLPPSRVEPQSRLAEDLKADELGQLEVLMALEEHFGVRIDERVEPPAPDVRGLAEQVAGLLAKRC
jgi:acyl carrier protein